MRSRAGRYSSAIDALAKLPDTRLIRASRLYRSPPMDDTEQPDYINAVASLLTQLDAPTFLHALQAIEKQHGRDAWRVAAGPRGRSISICWFSATRKSAMMS